MKKVLSLVLLCLFTCSVNAEEIRAENLKLTAEQNQKMLELTENLKKEVEPIWEDIEKNRQKITDIEKKYFEAFWLMLTEEQRQEFTKQ